MDPNQSHGPPPDEPRLDEQVWRRVLRVAIASQQIIPEAYDLDDVDLATYKGIQPPWNHWQQVVAQCRLLGNEYGETLI